MPTQGQAAYLNRNINSFVALVFVGTLALAVALIVWHASVGDNPIADFLSQNSALQAALQ
jgi:hypothetical protein